MRMSAPASPPALIVSDFVEAPARAATNIEGIYTYQMWVENRDIDVITGSARGSGGGARLSRPPQWEKAEVHRVLRNILGERGLSHATIGTDLQHISQDSLNWLNETNRHCTFVDMTDVL